jgi:hypothetical protein
MSRNLPYFKFFTGEWLSGDITLLDYDLQGVFINLCAYYWHRECEVTYKQAQRKFGADKIVELIDEGLILVDYEDDPEALLTIKFLDEQFDEMKTRKKILSEAGKKGAKRKQEKATIKPPLSHPSTIKEDQEKEQKKKKKPSITERKEQFAKKVFEFIPEFDPKMVDDFFGYWTEHGDNDTKMRFEKQTSFSIKRRLGTWKRNSDNYGTKGHTKNNNQARSTQAGRQDFG